MMWASAIVLAVLLLFAALSWYSAMAVVLAGCVVVYLVIALLSGPAVLMVRMDRERDQESQ
ncbi:hypothetical protein GT755_38350 [Herbidospora sp. NEAU-GS84]|uniref:Uncharacterized protein n=1 Tax=Herbidospora solisilvae TaxID=2696284 RepID=A0A7C9P3A9_9ACTN|nr:hypothetical protein [Herbidospora solisilvae]NAS27517.1 hypothetical protein [Herbidospora solisilvae]